MKKFLLIVGLLVFTSTLFAGEKDADAVYLKMTKEYTLNDDGTVVYHQAHQLKLQSYYAVNRRYGETFVVFDTTTQKLTVNRNQTTMAEGKKADAPANAFNLVLPRFAANAAAYNHLREMVITHIGLELNAVIDLDYQIESSPEFMPGLMGNLLLAEEAPIKELVVRLQVPFDKNLKFKLFNCKVEPVVSTADGRKIYTWKLNDVPATILESNQPDFGDFMPRLQFSSNDDFNSAAKDLLASMKNLSIPQDFELEGATQLEKAINAQKRLIEELVLFPIPTTVTGYRFRSPAEVWESAGGTELERAILLAAVLNNADIEATPILLAARQTLADDVPSLPAFNKAVVCVHPSNGQRFLMDVNKLHANDLRYMYGGCQALAILPDGVKLVTIPRPEPTSAGSALTANIQLEADLISSGSFTLQLSGATNPYLDIQRKNGAAEYLLQKVITESKFESLAALSASELNAKGSFEQENSLKEQEGVLFYELPPNPFGTAAMHLDTWAATRYTPVHLPYLLNECNQYNISIPDGYKVVSKEWRIEKENEAGHINIQLEQDGTALKIKRMLTLKKQEIPLNEYEQYFELWRLWNADSYKQVIMKK